ncbi:MAG: hypothetical protein JW940_22040 [Polyangiaceae bacterium]|nr:hypothetical protein [Polyangiaceae bacterium]
MGSYHGTGEGDFFDFNGAVDAGALLAGSWGVSRLIDALEVVPEANIDPRRLAAYGASMFGKYSVTSGALDARIALTISHDADLGGDSSWRLSQADFDAGLDVLTLESEAAEWAWFRNDFGLFGDRVNRLPFDQHEVLGMVAPRGLLVLTTEWSGSGGAQSASDAARLIYDALGFRENIGRVHGTRAHGALDVADVAALEAFTRKFLLQEDVDTDYWVVENEFDRDRWVDWEVPELR